MMQGLMPRSLADFKPFFQFVADCHFFVILVFRKLGFVLNLNSWALTPKPVCNLFILLAGVVYGPLESRNDPHFYF